MVGASGAASFAEEAARIGHRLATSALRHNGRATWLADEYAFDSATWCRATGTLGGDVGMGTAGVGLFLAHLASLTHDARVSEAALEATRHALARVDSLLAASRFGWFDGALGVIEAATMVADLLDRDDVRAVSIECEARTLTVMQQAQLGPDVGLLHGTAGTLTGLIAVARRGPNSACTDGTAAMLSRAAAAVLTDTLRADTSAARPATGLAQGNSGIALALCALSPEFLSPEFPLCALSPEYHASSVKAAVAALDAERRCFQPGYGWWCDSPHAWYPWDPDARVGSNCGWCAGAAGIGVARLIAYRTVREPRFLAESVAAIEVVLAGLADEEGGTDDSICHGWAGQIELLLLASTLLAEPMHLDAARAAALRRLATYRAGQGFGSGLWPGAHNPSLLLGLAGVGLTLLRLYDPACAPSAALPACLGDGQPTLKGVR